MLGLDLDRKVGWWPEPVLWSGKALRQWLPAAVGDVISAVAPRRIVLFGSVARGDEGPDSDLDLLVVLDRVTPSDRGAVDQFNQTRHPGSGADRHLRHRPGRVRATQGCRRLDCSTGLRVRAK
jgi:Nucleotidyltransferase domain